MAYCLASVVFFSTLGIGVFAFAIPLLAAHKQISSLLLGATFSGYFFAKLVISPVAGPLADRVGPRPLLLIAAFGGMLAPLAAFLAPRHEILYVVQFFLGLSSGVIKPVSTAAIATLVPSQGRGRMFGLCNALYNAAFFLGPALGGLLFYNRDLVPVLLFLVGCMALSFLLIFLFTPAQLSTLVPPEKSNTASRTRLRFSAGTLLLAVCGRTLCIACLIAFYPALLSKSLHGPTWLVGLLFAVPSLVACVGLPFGGWLADKVSREPLAVLGMVLGAVSLALAGRATTAMEFIFLGVFLGIGSILSFPASIALASSLGHKQGRIMGWFHAAANAGFVIGPLLCGFLVEHYGELALPMTAIGWLGLIATLPMGLLWLWQREGLSWRSSAALLLSVFLFSVGFIGFQGGALLPSQAAPNPQTSLSFAGLAMGNIVNMTLEGVDARQGGAISQQAFQTVDRLEAEYSHRNYAGSVGRVNLASGLKPVQVGAETFALLKRALKICDFSAGVFDVTIGAVTVLPQYYREKAEQEKAHLVDYRKVVLNEEEKTVFLPEKGMALDFGGLAKGTVLDGAAATLRKGGVPAALVEAGGDMFCYGEKQWKVGIQNPRGNGLLGTITVANAGVCGSGDYYQYVVTEGDGKEKRKHHILDPALLDSADESIAVTVVAPSAELADALATTLFILGPQKGQQLLKRFENCGALWVLPDESIVISEGFPDFSKN